MKSFLITIVLFPFICCAQKQANIWYFGDHAGLDFNSGNPVVLTDGATYDGPDVGEGTAVISDDSGNLLFYSNGQKIWNRNHVIMSNGDSLLGNYSSTQAALIIPQPGSSRYFYVFTTDAFQNHLQNGFRYSVVDMCLANGLGDVMPDKKNIKLLDTVAEKQTAVRHSNGVDYWIIVHKYLSDAFYAYRISNGGIVDTVISHIGSIHQGYCGIPSSSVNAMGGMNASPNGNKLAIVSAQQCNNISELFDFNKTTGVVSNMIKLHTDSVAVGLYGVSFSPDNSKLYITSWMNHDRIYQYDLSTADSNAIINSKTIITSHNGGPFYLTMQLGTDGKLYIAEQHQDFMGIIHFPNLAGTNCAYEDTTLYLNGKKNAWGLPEFIAGFSYSNSTVKCQTNVDTGNDSTQVIIFPNPFVDEIFVRVGNNEAAEIILYDAIGRKMLQQKFISSTTINTKHFAKGMYIYTLRKKNILIKKGKVVKH